MAESTQYSFSLDEVAKILVREQGLKAGKWTIGFEISINVGTIGPNVEDARPGAVMQVTSVTLAKAPPGSEASPLTVDATSLAKVGRSTAAKGK